MGQILFLQCHMMEMPEGKRCTVGHRLQRLYDEDRCASPARAAHAGFAPDEGINALGMAQLALNNINAVRETFRDEDRVRVSVVLTEGGELVNVVPSTAAHADHGAGVYRGSDPLGLCESRPGAEGGSAGAWRKVWRSITGWAICPCGRTGSYRSCTRKNMIQIRRREGGFLCRTI